MIVLLSWLDLVTIGIPKHSRGLKAYYIVQYLLKYSISLDTPFLRLGY